MKAGKRKNRQRKPSKRKKNPTTKAIKRNAIMKANKKN